MSIENKGRSRMAAPNLRKDALVIQARKQQQGKPPEGLSPLVLRPAHISRSSKPMTGSQRRAAKRLEKQLNAASKIQQAFRSQLARRQAKKELSEVLKGQTPEKLMSAVGSFYEGHGLIRKVKQVGGINDSIDKNAGRLAGEWSGGVDTQKEHLNRNPALDKSETVHHTVSDHFLGFVNAGIQRLEAGTAGEQSAAQKFRLQIKKDSLHQGVDHAKALFQVQQNLTFGPKAEDVKGDPKEGFDATFSGRGKNSANLKRDWDKRSTHLRPVHNMGLLLKSGRYELTQKGAEHLSQQFEKARIAHDTDMHGKFYGIPTTKTVTSVNPLWNSKKSVAGVKREIKTVQMVTEPTQQTIPVHGINSGHYETAQITRKNKTIVSGFRKLKWR